MHKRTGVPLDFLISVFAAGVLVVILCQILLNSILACYVAGKLA